MADSDLYVRQGVPWKVDQDQALQITESGGSTGARFIPKAEAVSGEEALQDMSYVDKNWGVAGKLGMGLASGLTLGLAPGLSGLDPGHLQAAQLSPWYTGGDVAGTILPGLLTGGSSLEGRSAIAAAMRATPAGLLEAAGSGTERLVGGVLGSSTGALGKLAASPLKMAARGAVEGAAINLGHTVGDNLIHNKPLAAESLLASGADGALFGAFIGGTLGTVGSIGSMATESVGKSLGYASRSKRAEGLVAKRLGMSAEGVESATSEYGTVSGFNKKVGELLEKSETGAKISSTDTKLLEGVSSGKAAYLKDAAFVVSELDKVASHQAPSLERVFARFDANIAHRVGTAEEGTITNFYNGVKAKLANVKPTESAGPWTQWTKSRDFLTKELSGPYRAEALNVLDSEIRAAMEGAAETTKTLEGLPAKYAAAQTGVAIAEQLEGSLGKRAADKLLSTQPIVSPNELAYAGLMAANGNPAAAMAFVAGKGIVKQVVSRLEPALAQMAFDASVGAKASAATGNVQASVAKSLKSFFTKAVKTPYKATVASGSRPKPYGSGVDRRAFEEAASRTEQLMSKGHQDKVRRYAESLYNMGYQDFGKSLMDTNNRAISYLTWNQPARQGTKGLTSLRPMPASKVPTLQEYKFYRMDRAIKNPLSLLEDLESGSLSRDAVNAVKYVYPEIHAQVVQSATEQIYAMKAAGESLPMSKITMLGIALDSPVDSTLTPEYINSVQMALNAPPPDSPDQDLKVPDTSVTTEDLMTATQKLQAS